MNVPFVDLKSQYRNIKQEIDKAILDVLESSAFAAGPFVEEFENAFASAHDSKYCVGVNSGTAALHIVLMALNIKPGDEIIVPANTFIATPAAVSLTGATPVFVDCEPDYFNIDPEKIESKITSKTKAIIPVHLYGQAAQMNIIKKIADKHKLFVIEDCAQAHLAEFNDQKVGNFGVAGCFSFYPGKNLGAYGEGGAVVTNDKKLYDKMMALRSHGAHKKYYHDLLGHNYRLEGMQGAILKIKLNHLANWTKKRKNNATQYRKLLNGLPIGLPAENDDSCHVYHLFVIRTKQRHKLQKFLTEHGIETGIHYPIPCHLQKAYRFLQYPVNSFPVAEEASKEILSLPMHEQLSHQQIEFVCLKIKKFFNQ